MPESVYCFAEALRSLLDSASPTRLESRWHALQVDTLGWNALEPAWRDERPEWESVLQEVDGLLLGLLNRVRRLAAGSHRAAIKLRTFRLPALERLQHGTVAALVAQRFGRAGLRTVVADTRAPLARRYYAFLAIAERHPGGEWPLFWRYLNPVAHHAFVGTAAEAARFYPQYGAAARLMRLFEQVRSDGHLRAFLSPRILESLYVLEDRTTLPFFRALLTAGHTEADPEHCEITRALVMVRRFTGWIEPNSKYADVIPSEIERELDAAESIFEAGRDVLCPVLVI
jgi:hypothetical protein